MGLFPQFKVTPWDFCTASILQAMDGWNFPLEESNCCSFHAAVQKLRQIETQLSQSPCRPWTQFLAEQYIQCDCGTLNHVEDEYCSLCACEIGFRADYATTVQSL